MSTLVDAPARVDGVQLIGEMVGSGYRIPPALVRRHDGQVLQLTPLLYLVLNAADGRRSCAEIAELVGRSLSRTVTEADVQTLVERHLRPLGLIAGPDGSAPELTRSNPLLGLKPRFAITSPKTTRWLTDPFRVLFRPLIVAAAFACFLAVVVWVFFDRGLGASAYDAFERPHLLLLVFMVSVLSGGFHEFGHAAAARYSGAQPGAMGAGLYIVWPAFYTDVTDSYRLGRAGRIRTDLGGLYFNAIVVVLTFAVWWWTGWEAVLLLVATQVLQMVQQLLPLLRFDGYHLLADLTGVPDLYRRIKPTLLGLLPHRWNSPENRVLKPWARAVITLWVLVTIPMMALLLIALVAAVPRLVGSAGAAIRDDAGALASAWGSGRYLDVAGHSFEVLAVALPVAACALILGRIATRWLVALARWSHGSQVRRVAAAALSAALITAVAWAWWPHQGNYRPIEPGERGTFTALVDEVQTASGVRPAATGVAPVRALTGTAAEGRLASGEPLTAVFEQGTELPTRDDPALAMVLVPSGSGDSTPSSADVEAAPHTAGEDHADAWVFPFDAPLPPAEGDNQALAVATADGAVAYDLAFALVWAEGDEVLNVNEAHAYASCSDCVAVAVAFQVVLIMDDARVVVPQNLAVSANYDCYRCITAAIASQLVLSLEEEPGEEELLALGEVWTRLAEFAEAITTFSLTEITAQLESFKAEIVGILGEAPPVDAAAAPTPSPTESAVPGATGSPSTAETTAPAPAETTTAPATADPMGPAPAETSSLPEATTDPAATSTTEPAPTSTADATSAEPSPTPSPSPTAETTAGATTSPTP